MSAGANPYAKPPPSRHGEAPNPASDIWHRSNRYAVPDIPESTVPGYTTAFSPELRSGGSPDGTALPDDIRIGTREPPVNNPNDHRYNAVQKGEFLRRASEEKQISTGWQIKQQRVPAPKIPEWTQDRLPTRPTASMSPMGSLFQRPWHIPRNVTEAVGPDAITHLSLADHRRRYEIMGMKPQGGLGVNTYRASPRPWDENLYYPPTPVHAQPPVSGNRAYRL